MVNVTLGNRRAVKVKVNIANTGHLVSSSPVIVSGMSGPTRMDALTDVDSTTEIEGGVPVYHSANDTYTIEKLDFDLLADIGEIDGGTF